MELIDKARAALYNIDAPLVSPQGKAIDKALTTCEEEIVKLKEERDEYRRLWEFRAKLNIKATRQSRLIRKAAEARAIQAEQEREILAEFIRDMIRDGCWNIDGGDLQDKAEKSGLLRAEIYDPEKHGDDFDGEPGEDEIYVFSGLLERTKDE